MSSIPGTTNGESHQWIPPDLEWDENDHPMIYSCSMHIKHHPNCDHKCGDRVEIDSELQVKLLNEGRAYARAGMSFLGVPAAYSGKIPITGIPVELLDLLMWMQTIMQLLVEQFDVDEFEFQELFRQQKFEFLHTIREANQAQIEEARMRRRMAIATKPLLGPDGKPLH